MKEKQIVGVIVKSKFITHTSDKFNSYINYMNREMMLIVDILCIVITWVILKKQLDYLIKKKIY